MRKIKFVLVVFFFSIGTTLFVVNAQDQATVCTEDNVNLAIAAVAKAAQDAQAASDPKAAVDVLAATSAQIASLQSDCSGLSFAGEKPGVIGPVDIPEGIYKAIGSTTSGHLTITSTVLEGECGQGSGSFLSASIFIGVKDESETIYSSTGCSVLFESQDENWSLRFEKIK